MAEEAQSKGGVKSKFLSKSKWGKVFKENDSPPAPGKVSSFKLNEDVVDFLKPSTEKSKPKIDVAIAQRWPEAHEVRRASEATTPFPQGVPQWTGYRKPRRREGLVVGFVKTAPEIIGEGGDEAPDPVSEVSRRKAAMSRSVSDRRPSAFDNGTPWPGTQSSRAPPRQARVPAVSEDDFRPQPVRRVQTSHNEFSPPVQRKHATPPVGDEEPFNRPTLSRTPTGFNSQENGMHLTPTHDDNDSPMEQMRLPKAGEAPPAAARELNRSGSRRRQRGMAASEGMALRRASALYTTEGDGDQLKSPNTGIQPSPQFYNRLSNASMTNIAPVTTTSPQEQLSPESARSPDGPSPFADPRYTKRHSGEIAPAPQQAQQPPAESLRQTRSAQQPSYMRADPSHPSERHRPVQPSYMRSDQNTASSMPPPQQRQVRPSEEQQPSYMRAMQPPNSEVLPTRPAPAPSYSSNTGGHIRASSRNDGSPVRRPVPTMSTAFGHTRSSSREEASPHVRVSPSDNYQTSRQSSQEQSPRSSLLGPGRSGNAVPSPYSRGPSPADYFSAPKAAPMQPARSPAANLRQEEAARPGSSGSTRSAYRGAPPPLPQAHNDPSVDAAFADFASRVAHMKGVFRLTAEKECPADHCTPAAWLRTALWWYLRGKAGLESMLQQRPRSPEAQREILAQPHVDLAKSWWILSDHLEEYGSVESPKSARSPDGQAQLPHSVATLRNHLKSLCGSMAKSQLMPPPQSLIQGQDTTVWLQYPRFTADASAVLSGSTSRSLIIDSSTPSLPALEALPLGETRDVHCFGRFLVDISINTDEADTDRVTMPCTLTMLRGKRDFQPSIVVASQSDLVNIRLGPRRGEDRGLSWHEISWKTSSYAMAIHLPRGFDLTVRMMERDFRSLWNLVEYARKVEHSLRPADNEHLVHEARLTELQYADSSGGHAFPSDKLRSCTALVFERTEEHRDGSGVRKMHRGHRLLLFTEPSHKSMSSVSISIGSTSPLFFELITDAAAQGTTAMVIRVREDGKQCRALLVFPDMVTRQALYDVLNGLTVSPDETIVGKMNLTGLNIEATTQAEGFSTASHPALGSLQWQKLGVTNGHSDDPNSRIPETVESESLRIIARHATGCVTDRLNFGKGEMLMRLPPGDSPMPAIQLLRQPQEDLTMSIDTRQSPPQVADGIAELYRLAQQQSTIRTFSFAYSSDLHAFQTAITGFAVRYDGIASTFGISHRMMYVPVYQKKQASNVRLQVVSHDSVTQVLAFMDDFSLTDALCFQVKSTDTFESVKGDSKSKKWAVKMVDAKFSLPRQEKGDVNPEEKVRRRFVNLEGLDYAEEHDDITVGFDTEQDRDRFAQALPAATTVGRMITLKRRI